MKENILRDYRMPDADLAVFGLDLANFMTRDTVEFAAKGVVTADITALTAKANEFLIYPNDAFYEGQVMQAAINKNAHRETIQIMIRDIVGLATIKWGSRSTQVHAFHAGNLTNEPDSAFLGISSQAVATSEAYLSDLTSLGLTQAMIDALETECAAMSTDLSQISVKSAERQLMSEGRVELGNELYELVTKYCEIGKIIWDDVDPAKYENYVIYSYPPGVPGKIMNMLFTPSTNTVTWSAELTSDSYQLQYAPNSPSPVWAQIYLGTATQYRHDGVSGVCLYRCRGINENGNGYWSDVMVVAR